MASRSGVRPTGSDGADYGHRERVASHYHTSAANKSRLRFVIYLHFMLVVLMLLRLSPNILLMANVKPPAFLLSIGLPDPSIWEYAWVVSVLPCFFGLAALGRNRTFVLRQFSIGTALFALTPVVWGIVSLSGDLLQYWNTRETKSRLFGFPVVVLWNTFLIIALQLHGIELVLARVLSNAWTPVKKKE